MTARAYLRLILAALWLLICLPLWAIARLYGGERVWVRRFLAGIGRLLGLRVGMRGKPLPAPTLFVGNHISWLDILALGGHIEVGFIAKAEIEKWPLVGGLAKLGGSIFVSRDRRSSTRNQADSVAEALKQGRSVVLFAEGGTADGIEVWPFRAPLFVSAIEAGVPVQPVAIDYGPGRRHFAWPHGASFGSAAKGLLNRSGPAPVTLKFLEPLDATVLDRKQLAQRSREEIVAALDPSHP